MELTRLEQKVLNLFNDGDVTSIANLYKINELMRFAKTSTVKELAFRLTQKKFFVRLSRGRYVVVKIPSVYDPLKIANYIFDGYIALSSALFVYGYNQARSFSIFGTTAFRKKIRKIGEYEYTAVPMGRLTSGVCYHDGYKVSTKAKTLFDCIYNIQFVDDLGPLFRLVRDMGQEDFDELFVYLKLSKNLSMIQRTGFFLEKAHAPKNIIYKLDAAKGNSIIKLNKKDKRCTRYNKRWKIFDNINLDRFIL